MVLVLAMDMDMDMDMDTWIPSFELNIPYCHLTALYTGVVEIAMKFYHLKQILPPILRVFFFLKFLLSKLDSSQFRFRFQIPFGFILSFVACMEL